MKLYNLYHPLLCESNRIEEYTVKMYINFIKASEDSEYFLQLFREYLGIYNIDIFSLYISSIYMRGKFISDDRLKFTNKINKTPLQFYDNICEYVNKKTYKGYNKTKTLPQFPLINQKPDITVRRLGEYLIYPADKETLSLLPASYFNDHISWYNKNVIEYNNTFRLQIYDDYFISSDEQNTADFIKAMIIPYSLNYIYTLLSVLGKEYNFDGSYWENKSLSDCLYFYNLLNTKTNYDDSIE